MNSQTTSSALTRRVRRAGVRRLIAGWIAMPAFFLATGGSLGWWQAWTYCGVLLIPATVFGVWMTRNDPAFIERRLKIRESEPAQRRLQLWGTGVFLLLLALPGLDHRFGWSHPPVVAQLAAMIVVFASYLGVLRVLVVNRWAGRTVETYAKQTVVATGSYAVVRHPMYAAVLALSLATPLALGSWWALLPMMGVVPLIVLRIRNEEAVLIRELRGYETYRAEVPWRLIPRIW